MRRIRITIAGRVQGVFFRKSAQARATALGLSGWVKNLDDGRVQAEVQGEPYGLELFTEWCRKGPDLARVTAVDTEIMPPQAEKGFRILY